MDTALQALLSYQFILLCLAIAAITYVFRLTIEFFILDNPKMPGTRTSKFWRNLALPVSPVFFGVILCLLVKTGIYPEGIVTQAARVNIGLVAGLLSGLIYRVVVGMLAAKIPPSATVTTVTTVDPTNMANPVSSVTTVETLPPAPVVPNPNPTEVTEELKQLAADVSKTISKE
jgi:hypothetical protein